MKATCPGFDGKTLIHPGQIEAVIAIEGRMLERLHLARAERVLAKAGAGR